MGTPAVLYCPSCGCDRLYKASKRKTAEGLVLQRYLCRECSLRFSEKNPFKLSKTTTARQLCAKKDAKKLEAEQQTTEVLRRDINTGDFKQKILEYALWLKNSGKSEATIIGRIKLLKRLTKRGANLYDPESMKTIIAQQKWSN